MGSFNRGGQGGGRSFGGGRDFGGRNFDRGGDRGGNDRQMFRTTCSNCGKDCEVPFRPSNGKPVYCSECFEKMGNRNDNRSSDRGGDRGRFSGNRPSFSQPSSNSDSNKAQFEALNARLDKIIRLLEQKNVSVQTPKPEAQKDPIVEVTKEEKEAKTSKPSKAKKSVKKATSKKA